MEEGISPNLSITSLLREILQQRFLNLINHKDTLNLEEENKIEKEMEDKLNLEDKFDLENKRNSESKPNFPYEASTQGLQL